MSRRPGVPQKTTAAATGDALPLLEQVANLDLPLDLIVSEIQRLRAGDTRFVTAVLESGWVPSDPADAEVLAFLSDETPPANLPHSSMRRPGVRK